MATRSSFNRLSRKWGEKGRMEENGREEKREPYTEFAAGVLTSSCMEELAAEQYRSSTDHLFCRGRLFITTMLMIIIVNTY